MAFDYFTLQALAAELQDLLKGKKITTAVSSAESLGFSCDRGPQVYARVGPQGYLCALHGDLKPENPVPLNGPERYLHRARVEDIWAEKRDRIIHIRLSRKNKTGSISYGQLIFELIRPYCQVCLIGEQTGEVLGKWAAQAQNKKPQRISVGQYYTPPAGQKRLLPGEDGWADFKAAIQGRDGPVADLMARVVVGMDKTLAPEILHRANLPVELDATQTVEGDLERLWEEASRLYFCFRGTKGFIWQRGDQEVFSALEPLGKKENCRMLPSISEAIVRAYQGGRSSAGNQQREQNLEQILIKTRKSMQKKIRALRQDLEEAGAVDELQRKGNILMAQLAQVRPGAQEVELRDIYDISGTTSVKIELNPRRSPADNGKYFLKTARKYQRRCRILPGRIKKMEVQLAEVEVLLGRFEEEGEVDCAGIQNWLEKNEFAEKMERKRKRQQESVHPRRYRTSKGWSVWVGRNNRENDQLTHRLAAQNDIWLHAHGYPGAHVVLRREEHREEPGARNLEEAAAIAAYWSKGKTAKKVPVVYTQVKYVSKPRGGAPGQALLRREKTLIVEPALPAEEDE